MTVPGKIILETSRFRVEEVQQKLAGGQTRTRAIVRHPGAVAVLPLVTPDSVCLIHNYRIAADQTLVELPAGTLEPNEPPAETAARELIEETGFRAGRIEHLQSFYLSPGIMDERMHLYVATDLVQVGAAREPGEEIENWIVSWSEAMDLVAQGRIQDAKSLVGLLYYDRFRRG